LLGLATRRMFWLYGESFHHHRLNHLDDNRARSYHYQIYAPPLGCLDLILSWVAIGSSQSMQEPTTAQTNVCMCLFIQETSWNTSNTFLARYRSGGTPNEPWPQDVCELQGQRIEASSLPALVLPVNACQWVLADNRPTPILVYHGTSGISLSLHAHVDHPNWRLDTSESIWRQGGPGL
jgi:hypothetical protein